MSDLSSLITGENAALIGAIVAIISTIRAVFPSLMTNPSVKRFLPLIPMVIGLLAVFAGFGNAGDALSSWQDKLVLGFIVGFAAGQMYKAGKTSFLGWSSSASAPAPALHESYPGAYHDPNDPMGQQEGD